MARISGNISSKALNKAIPIFAPPYRAPKTQGVFTGVTCIAIKYRTTGKSIVDLIPDILEFDEQPIVTSLLINYAYSPIGAYNELIHYIEVYFQGKKYDYPILLVLDNEDAVYGGREVWGYPKVMGTFDFQLRPDGTSGFTRGVCSRPAGNPIAEFMFKPVDLHTNFEEAIPSNIALGLRLVPSVVPDTPPAIRQFLEVEFRLKSAEVWEGIGSLKFPSTSEFDPLHKFPVVEYVSAHLLRNAVGTQGLPGKAFDF